MDKRGEMARLLLEGQRLSVKYNLKWLTQALQDSFDAGASLMRERAAKVAARYQARAVADHIDALPLDPKEAQDAEG